MAEWTTGRVRKLYVDRGYGFIEAGLGRDVFFHCKTFTKIEREFLKEGVEVKFQIEENDGKLRAYRVTLLGQEGVA
jgi:cold shock CspA family protein